MRPLGAKPLSYLNPDIFSRGLNGLEGQWPNPLANAKSFSDSPFFAEAQPASTSSGNPLPNLQATSSNQPSTSPSQLMPTSSDSTSSINLQKAEQTPDLDAADSSLDIEEYSIPAARSNPSNSPANPSATESRGNPPNINLRKVASTPQPDAIGAKTTDTNGVILQRSPEAATVSIAAPSEPAQSNFVEPVVESVVESSPESTPEQQSSFDYNNATTVDWPGGFETAAPASTDQVMASVEPGQSQPAPSFERSPLASSSPALTPDEAIAPSTPPLKTSDFSQPPAPTVLQAKADAATTVSSTPLSDSKPDTTVALTTSVSPTDTAPSPQTEPSPGPTELETLHRAEPENIEHHGSELSSKPQSSSFPLTEASATHDIAPSLQLQSELSPGSNSLDSNSLGSQAESSYRTTIDWPGDVGQPLNPAPPSASSPGSLSPLSATNPPQLPGIQAKASSPSPTESPSQDTNIINPSIEALASPSPHSTTALSNQTVETAASSLGESSQTLTENTASTSPSRRPNLQAQSDNAGPDAGPIIDAKTETSAIPQPFQVAEPSIQKAEAASSETDLPSNASSPGSNSPAPNPPTPNPSTEFTAPESTSSTALAPQSTVPEIDNPPKAAPLATATPASVDSSHSTNNVVMAKPAIEAISDASTTDAHTSALAEADRTQPALVLPNLTPAETSSGTGPEISRSPIPAPSLPSLTASETNSSIQTQANSHSPTDAGSDSHSPESSLEVNPSPMGAVEQQSSQLNLSPVPTQPISGTSSSSQTPNDLDNSSAALPASPGIVESLNPATPSIQRAAELTSATPATPAIPNSSESPQQNNDASHHSVAPPDAPSITALPSTATTLNRSIDLPPTAPTSTPTAASPSEPPNEAEPTSQPMPSPSLESGNSNAIQRSLTPQTTTANRPQSFQPQDRQSSPPITQAPSDSFQDQPSPVGNVDNLPPKPDQPSSGIQLQKQLNESSETIEPAIAPEHSSPTQNSTPSSNPPNSAPSETQPVDFIASGTAELASPQSPVIQPLAATNPALEQPASDSFDSPSLLQATFSERHVEQQPVPAESKLADKPEPEPLGEGSSDTAAPSEALQSPPPSVPNPLLPNDPAVVPAVVQAKSDHQSLDLSPSPNQPASSSPPKPLPSSESNGDRPDSIPQPAAAAETPQIQASKAPSLPSNWDSIADLLAQSEGLPASAAPVTSPATTTAPSSASLPNLQAAPAQPIAPDAYADLQPYHSPSPVLQRSPAIQVEPDTESPESEAIAEISAPESESGTDTDSEAAKATSGAKLEELAQVIYRMMQQRMAIDRERSGSNYASRFYQ